MIQIKTTKYVAQAALEHFFDRLGKIHQNNTFSKDLYLKFMLMIENIVIDDIVGKGMNEESVFLNNLLKTTAEALVEKSTDSPLVFAFDAVSKIMLKAYQENKIETVNNCPRFMNDLFNIAIAMTNNKSESAISLEKSCSSKSENPQNLDYQNMLDKAIGILQNF